MINASPEWSTRQIISTLLSVWRHNPLCHQLWKKIRWYAWIFFGLNVLLAARQGRLFEATMFETASDVVFIWGMLSTVYLLLAPFIYAPWAWNTTWAGNPESRNTVMPKRERLAAVVLPLMVAYLLAAVPSLLSVWILFAPSSELGSLPDATIATMVVATLSALVLGPMLQRLVLPVIVLREFLRFAQPPHRQT